MKKEIVSSYVAKIVIDYLDTMIEKIEIISDEKEKINQLTLIGKRSIEISIQIGKGSKLVFDQIFTRFKNAKHEELFVNLLEPFILADKLTFLPEKFIKFLFVKYEKKLDKLEECILHLDISTLDFKSVCNIHNHFLIIVAC